MIIALEEGVESGLLLEHIGGRGLGGLRLQREMRPFVAAILLGMSGLDALDVDAEAEPPGRRAC